MSKILEKKTKQGFQKKCPCCSNCNYFSFQIVTEENRFSITGFQTRETSFKCNIGNFAVQKTNWCEKHDYSNLIIK